MKPTFHPFHKLFAQLGLNNDAEHIEAFLQTHSLAQDVALADAPFWSPGQAEFLRTALQDDSDWSYVVDALNAALHN